MKLVTLKSIFWFCVILLLALSFPIQVAFSSPLPALFPYVGITLISFLTLLSPAGRHSGLFWRGANTRMNLLIGVYLFLVLFQTGWQTMFGFITIEQGISAMVTFILPMVFFLYFTRLAADQEIHSVLLAIAWAGFGVGLYFVYDSYSMLAIGRLNDFSLMAYEYSQYRANSLDINTARISIGSRSHGLLENHSVSAAWISLGCFAALALVPQHKIWWRMTIIAIYGPMLLIGLNFTGIVVFACVIFLMEFWKITWLRGRLSKRDLKAIVIGSGLSILMSVLLVWNLGDRMLEPIQRILSYQIDLAKGAIPVGGGGSYLGGLVDALWSFPFSILDSPLGLLVGDGFSDSFGMVGKGGDYGIVETLYRFGLPFFIAIIVGLISLSRRALKQMRINGASRNLQSCYLWFAVCVTVYLFSTEIHYSVWKAKSILPIFFLALALYARGLVHHHDSAQNSATSERIRST